MKYYLTIFKLFPKELHGKFVVIFFLQLLNAILEIFSFALIFPMLKILIDDSFLNYLINFIEIESIKIFLSSLNYKSFLLYSSFFVIIIYLIKTLLSIFINYKIFRFIRFLRIYMSNNFLNSNIHLSYFKYNSSSSIIRTINNDITAVCESVVTCLLNALTDIVLLLAILSFIFFIQPLGSVVSFLIFILSVGIYTKLTSKLLKKTSLIYQKVSGRLIENVQDIFRNIKEIKIFGKEKFFINLFNDSLKISEDASIKNKFYTALPKPVFEFAGILAIISFFLLSLKLNTTPESVITEVSLVAICAFRIIPSAARVSGNLTTTKYFKASVDLLYRNFEDIKKNPITTEEYEENLDNKLNFNKIIVKDVSFSYPSTSTKIFENIDLEIETGKNIGIIGKTGNGKSTFVELLCGLLTPSKGQISFLNKNGDLKNTNFGYFTYVSQNILLLDDSIRKNIAFGIEDEKINNNKIDKLVKICELETFVKKLENGLDTNIGEVGSKLSGGQRQRIGIARALYFDREIIILDEVTSALDQETEKKIISNLKDFFPKKTIIVISHRELSLSICDILYRIENKKIYKA